jgi:hypothetical protein
MRLRGDLEARRREHLNLVLLTYMPRLAVQSAAPLVQAGEKRTKVLLSGQKAAQSWATKTPFWLQLILRG